MRTYSVKIKNINKYISEQYQIFGKLKNLQKTVYK